MTQTKQQEKTHTYSIQYTGLNESTSTQFDKVKLDKIAHEFAEKYIFLVDNAIDLDIHIKEHEREGSRRRYEVHSRATYPGATVAAQGHEWELVTALRESLEGIEQQLKSKYKNSNKQPSSNVSVSDELSL